MGKPNTVSGAKIKPFYEREEKAVSRIKLSSLFDLKLTEMEGVDGGRGGAKGEDRTPEASLAA